MKDFSNSHGLIGINCLSKYSTPFIKTKSYVVSVSAFIIYIYIFLVPLEKNYKQDFEVARCFLAAFPKGISS